MTEKDKKPVKAVLSIPFILWETGAHLRWGLWETLWNILQSYAPEG